MAYETITLERTGGVAVLTLNRPDKLNALNLAMVRELTAALKEIGRDEAARAVVLTGAGRGFCAGADLTEGAVGGGETAEERGANVGRNMGALHNPLMRALARLPKPVVAAVNGPAAGGGMSLALAADITIAARSAYFVQVFGPQLGLVPDMGSSWLLPRAVGRARALGMTLTGERINAEQAADWGMIWACVDDGALTGEAMKVAERLAAGPTRGFALIKRALDATGRNGFDAQLDLERSLQSIAARSEDFSEGVAAFGEKRKPEFKGR